MSTVKVSVEEFTGKRLTYTSEKSFDDVIKAIREYVAPLSPSFATFWDKEGRTAQDVRDGFAKTMKPGGLWLFTEFSHGRLHRLFRPDAPRFHKFVIGSPIALQSILEHDPVAALHAPWNFLVLEVLSDEGKAVGTQVIYDLPSATMASKVGGVKLDEQSKKLDELFRIAVSSWL